MAISSSFTLQQHCCLPKEFVSADQSTNHLVFSQSKVLGFSQKPKFSNHSIRQGISFRRNRNDSRLLFELKCSKQNDAHPVSEEPLIDHGNGNGDDGGDGASSGGGGGSNGDGDGGGEGGGDYEEKEFGPIMKFEDVMREAEKRGAVLPSDILEAAKTTGIRSLLLSRYLELEGSGGLLGFLMRHCSMLRNRMLADPSFLFKVATEVVIDTCCATFAEVQKRGKDFWAEFELYAADILVGVVVDVALVGMLAPYARIGKQSGSAGFLGRLQHASSSLPSSVFEAERPGCRFSLQQRIATYFYKGVLYGAVGFTCGIIGQGIANMIMTAKRSIKKSEEDIPVPPLIKSAALWGMSTALTLVPVVSYFHI
ncbi:OLC1v1004465C1 [Oldenlandia corymbosa var. corymbosa]|uniref:OLC1v1004465C1 n=1 Tax=Oldenlandia corymbosa var. corymbosa TaxID=529605 RepID=A0AAV1DD33_OLDCO|nr:OLC1v1004465C1 [Oldenlandia corymbosa var. corymbosa]